MHVPRFFRSLASFGITVLLAGAGLALAQAAQPEVQVRYDAVLGHYLTGPNGMTLYVFTRDEPNVSNCYDQCATNWPPLLVDGDAVDVSPLSVPGVFGVTERTDGTRQVTYNGWPLYYWVNDAAPGDTNGQAVGNVWWAANLDPVIQVMQHPEHGPILVGPTGMTLYLFTNDEADKTNCYERCALRWPPLVGAYSPEAGFSPIVGEGVTGTVGMIARDDGGMQLTYNGQPLYYWINDHVPGDATGHTVGDVWFVVSP